MPTAIPIDGPAGQQARRARVTDRGAELVRHYKVLTTDIEAAIAATGLPAIGSSAGLTDPRLSGLRVVEYDIAFVGANWIDIGVVYRTPPAGGTIIAAGDDYTTVEASVFGFTALAGVVAAPDGSFSQDERIGGPVGGGAPVTAGQVDFLVHVIRNTSQFATYMSTNFGVIAGLTVANSLNNASVTLPSLYGVGAQLAFSARQLKFVTFSIGKPADNLFEIVFRLAFGDHDVRWQEYQSDGVTVAEEKKAAVYPVGDFSGLWTL